MGRGSNEQFRLEKAVALAFTEGLVKLLKRWIWNEFDQELMKFGNIFSTIESNAGDEKEVRLPTYQWVQWISFILLREVALLAKVNQYAFDFRQSNPFV
jgi:hypothetical protein